MDLLYFGLRLVLSGFAAAATWTVFRFVWRGNRLGGTLGLPIGGGLLLLAATALSTFDAIDNFILRPNEPITLASWLWLLFFDMPMPILAILLVWSREDQQRLLAEVSKMSVTDELTGALNRHGFFERAATSIAQAQRTGTPASLAIFDIDHFKAINDGYGHAAGDRILQAFSVILAEGRRSADLIGRIGGDEFALILYASTEEAASIVAERVCAEARRGIPHPAWGGKQVTVTGGVAAISAGLEPQVAVALALTAADEALYVAKREGRDRIVARSNAAGVVEAGTVRAGLEDR
jgi:diguanylate cyclase (GGDEF)-like protein